MAAVQILDAALFLSTPSARRATLPLLTSGIWCCISIHALREEGDRKSLEVIPMKRNFYPRPPRGGRRSGNPPRPPGNHFYPRPPRGGRRDDAGKS